MAELQTGILGSEFSWNEGSTWIVFLAFNAFQAYENGAKPLRR